MMSSLDLALLRFIFSTKVLQQHPVARSWAESKSQPQYFACKTEAQTCAEVRAKKAKNSTAANGHAGHADFTEKPRVDRRARRFAPCELRDSGVTNSKCGWLYIPANSDCGWEDIYRGIAEPI